MLDDGPVTRPLLGVAPQVHRLEIGQRSSPRIILVQLGQRNDVVDRETLGIWKGQVKVNRFATPRADLGLSFELGNSLAPRPALATARASHSITSP